MTLGVTVQQNSALSWRSHLVPHSINKRDPGQLDSAANGAIPLTGAIIGIYSIVEEDRGI